MGIDGILYAGPISDGVAAIIAIVMVRFEFKAMKRLEQNVEWGSNDLLPLVS